MIQKLPRSYRSWCIVCGDWEELTFRDPCLSQNGICSACALLVCTAERFLFKSGLAQPPTQLVHSRQHKLL